jgi:hypothetical protein
MVLIVHPAPGCDIISSLQDLGTAISVTIKDFWDLHDFSGGSNFGVTTPLWDMLLGTRYVRHSGKA